MQQEEAGFTLNGVSEKVLYRKVDTAKGVRYEGLWGEMAFHFSQDGNGFTYSPSLNDVQVRKPLIAAVLDREDAINNPPGKSK